MTAGSLSLIELTRRFGPHTAVDRVSFTVDAGELVALVGASGSGKTTTLRMVAGYEIPDAGRLTLGDPDGTVRDITSVPPAKRGFGMVFQHYALFPHMNVEENVAFGLEARGESRQARLTRAREALAAVGLEGAGGRAVQALSGGEQQRVALARAVVIEPRVLLLDEPLSNLDPALRQSTREELRSMLRRLHLTAVFVTHDQEDAFAIADRVALLEQGRLQQVGPPEELYTRPASRSVARFIGRSTIVPATWAEDGHVLLSIGGAARTVRATVGAAASPPGPELYAVLRPEALALVEPATAGAWRGVVVTRRFAGSAFVYHIRLPDDTVLEVSTPNGRAREGENVGVVLEAAAVAVVG